VRGAKITGLVFGIHTKVRDICDYIDHRTQITKIAGLDCLESIIKFEIPTLTKIVEKWFCWKKPNDKRLHDYFTIRHNLNRHD